MDHPKKLSTFLLIAFFAETLSVTWCLKLPGWAPFLSILYFSSGVALALLLLRAPALSLPAFRRQAWKIPINHYRLVVTGLAALMLYSWCLYWFDESPI